MRKEAMYLIIPFLMGCGDFTGDLNVGDINANLNAQGELKTGDIGVDVNLNDLEALEASPGSIKAALAKLEPSKNAVKPSDLIGKAFFCTSRWRDIIGSYSADYLMLTFEDGTGEVVYDVLSQLWASQVFLNGVYIWDSCEEPSSECPDPLPKALSFTYESSAGHGEIYGLTMVGSVLRFYNYNVSGVEDHEFEIVTCKRFVSEAPTEEDKEELQKEVKKEEEIVVQAKIEPTPTPSPVEPKILTFKEECLARADSGRSPPSLQNQTSDGSFYRKCTETSSEWGEMNYQLEFYSTGIGHVFKNDHSPNKGGLPTDVNFSYELLLKNPGGINDGGGVLYLNTLSNQSTNGTTVMEACITDYSNTSGVNTINFIFKRRQIYEWDDESIQTSQVICTNSNYGPDRINAQE